MPGHNHPFSLGPECSQVWPPSSSSGPQLPTPPPCFLTPNISLSRISFSHSLDVPVHKHLRVPVSFSQSPYSGFGSAPCSRSIPLASHTPPGQSPRRPLPWPVPFPSPPQGFSPVGLPCLPQWSLHPPVIPCSQPPLFSRMPLSLSGIVCLFLTYLCIVPLPS